MSEDEEFRVLHALRVTGFADSERVAQATGLPADVVAARLDDAAGADQVKHRTSRMTGYMLLGPGRERHEQLREQAAGAEQTAALDEAYAAFLAPNQEFKTLITAWQSESADARTSTVDRLESVHAEAGGLLERLSSTVPRFTAYPPRLDAALESFQGGDDDALAKPMSGSYHDVWMELHEDLLVSLGRERDEADG